MVFPKQIKKKHLTSYRKLKPVSVHVINHWLQISEINIFSSTSENALVILNVGIGIIIIGFINKYLVFDKSIKVYQFS
jgi:hypothetical protein